MKASKCCAFVTSMYDELARGALDDAVFWPKYGRAFMLTGTQRIGAAVRR